MSGLLAATAQASELGKAWTPEGQFKDGREKLESFAKPEAHQQDPAWERADPRWSPGNQSCGFPGHPRAPGTRRPRKEPETERRRGWGPRDAVEVRGLRQGLQPGSHLAAHGRAHRAGGRTRVPPAPRPRRAPRPGPTPAASAPRPSHRGAPGSAPARPGGKPPAGALSAVRPPATAPRRPRASASTPAGGHSRAHRPPRPSRSPCP